MRECACSGLFCSDCISDGEPPCVCQEVDCDQLVCSDCVKMVQHRYESEAFCEPHWDRWMRHNSSY
jgi:hypothetical protein